MKTLTITAGIFFAVCGALIVHFSTQAPSYEYDMNYVIPIDAGKMPKSLLPPAVTPTVQGEKAGETSTVESRAEAGEEAVSPLPKLPFRFDSWRPATSTEARANE